jgi:hypothetical protein
MKGLVIYDSTHGNTKTIAEAVAGTLGYDLALVKYFPSERLLGYEHIIFGSPTHRARATHPMMRLITELPFGCLVGAQTSAFDTRLEAKTIRLRKHEFELHIPAREISLKIPSLNPTLPQVGVEVKIPEFESRHTIKTLEHGVVLPIGKLTGYASRVITFLLRESGSKAMGKPDGFLVTDIEGPLADGELERAIAWAKSLK